MIVDLQTDGRRERKVRFGYREKSGATETLISKTVVLPQSGSPKGLPYRFPYNYALCILHSLRSVLYPIIPRSAFVVKKNRLTKKDGK
jgi:hypothetical protein